MDQDQEQELNNNSNPQNDLSDEDFAEVMRESSELSTPVTSARAERFYDRMRERIRTYLDKKAPSPARPANICCSRRTSSCCSGVSSTTRASTRSTR
jgi:hypothetical protein